MSKKLLVLAASSQQIETITTARRLGYHVLTLDNRPSNPGHALADCSYNIDTTEREAVLEVALREKIDGIIAACTDVAVPTAAYVAQKMNLKGTPFRSAQIVCNKVRFRTFLQSHGFPVPLHFPFSAGFNPDSCLFEGERWILKPDCSSGSKGTFIVDSKSEFLQRASQTLAFSPDGRGIMEKYIDGFQGTCEGFLKGGQLVLACILDRQTAEPPYVTTSGHTVPTGLPSYIQEMLLSELTRVWNTLEVTDGPFDCDFVATKDKVYLLEISPRIGGNSISSLLRTASGFDIVECSILYSLQEDMMLPHRLDLQPSAVVIFGVTNSGNLRYDRAEADKLLREPWVRALNFEIGWDGPVHPFINSRERIGYAIVVDGDRACVDSRVEQLKRRLNLRAEND